MSAPANAAVTSRPPAAVCEFCQGRPVGDARSWADGKKRPPAPCPRCGETNVPATPGSQPS